MVAEKRSREAPRARAARAGRPSARPGPSRARSSRARGPASGSEPGLAERRAEGRPVHAAEEEGEEHERRGALPTRSRPCWRVTADSAVLTKPFALKHLIAVGDSTTMPPPSVKPAASTPVPDHFRELGPARARSSEWQADDAPCAPGALDHDRRRSPAGAAGAATKPPGGRSSALHTRKVFGLAYRFTGRVDEAEDLTQEVFVKVYQTLDRYREADGPFGAWLMAVARNHAIDHYRRRTPGAAATDARTRSSSRRRRPREEHPLAGARARGARRASSTAACARCRPTCACRSSCATCRACPTRRSRRRSGSRSER